MPKRGAPDRFAYAVNPEQLEDLLASGTDNALLRYTLGTAYLKADRLDRAIEHLTAALAHDRNYSAAWKLYAKALADHGETEAAKRAYAEGIEVADNRGDVQAGKEMRVFLRRLERS